MGFGGAVYAMVTTLKNNKRDRKSAFKKMKQYESSSYKTDRLVFSKKATPDQLKKIRTEIRNENRKRLVFKTVSIVTLCIIIVVFLSRIKFSY
ncbi:hypothetical protein [Tenacibaculum amylolyticum]|uniref:hypothetical protein n=1 Tax=Tenacibaculum amylolyticum TaxID=104269 RepID=UPI003895F8E5